MHVTYEIKYLESSDSEEKTDTIDKTRVFNRNRKQHPIRQRKKSPASTIRRKVRSNIDGRIESKIMMAMKKTDIGLFMYCISLLFYYIEYSARKMERQECIRLYYWCPFVSNAECRFSWFRGKQLSNSINNKNIENGRNQLMDKILFFCIMGIAYHILYMIRNT
jgi:hypothetical protein